MLSIAVVPSFKKYPVITPPFRSPVLGWTTIGLSGYGEYSHEVAIGLEAEVDDEAEAAADEVTADEAVDVAAEVVKIGYCPSTNQV